MIFKKRTNDVLLQMAFRCIDQSMTAVHCFAITIAFESALTEENIAVFQILGDLLEEVKDHIILLVTHAELVSEEDRESFEKDIRSNSIVMEVCGGRIFFFGSSRQKLGRQQKTLSKH